MSNTKTDSTGSHLQHQSQKRRTIVACVVVMVAFGIWGFSAMRSSKAATNSLAFEAESGSVSAPAVVVNDSNAARGTAVRFGSGTNPPSPPTATKIFLGAAVDPEQMDNAAFTGAMKRYNFDSMVAENAMKFAPLQPNRGQFNWGGADKIVNYAQANGMRVRGHTLVWHRDVPGWVNGLSNADAASALEAHIKTVVGRWKGKIGQWDVVNEAFNDDGTLRDTVWRQKLGDGYIAKAFQWAREADPNVQLYYNEFSAEGIADRGGNKKAKSDAVYNLVRDFKARGIPIDGVGLQMHSAGDYPGTESEITANIKRLRLLGVGVEITELDVINIGNQAGRYAEMGRACRNGGCSGVTTWGLHDGDTWLAGKDPLLLDRNYQAKPAYPALMQTIGR